MKKTFIAPKADIKTIANTEIVCGSTVNINGKQVSGNDGNIYGGAAARINVAAPTQLSN